MKSFHACSHALVHRKLSLWLILCCIVLPKERKRPTKRDLKNWRECVSCLTGTQNNAGAGCLTNCAPNGASMVLGSCPFRCALSEDDGGRYNFGNRWWRMEAKCAILDVRKFAVARGNHRNERKFLLPDRVWLQFYWIIVSENQHGMTGECFLWVTEWKHKHNNLVHCTKLYNKSRFIIIILYLSLCTF